ncbi:MAG: GNAT family N-acetyltransferase, partial [Alphaproteobacteria bacterium]|nr:GNAT family N-acetyltransferase [Alphaproteobacteria bacterium]
NQGYGGFDDFLDDLSSRKRKTIRRERRRALENGIEIEWITGADLTEAHWDAFYQFYTDTGSRKWGEPYLNRQFFSLITESMAERTLLIMCRREGRYIAGALNLIGAEALFGRYWGCIEDHPFLHFEICYYQAIDYAIQHGLSRVEAGAQGPHKIARGYRPTQTHSAHYIRDPGFRDAVANYLEHERKKVGQDIEYLAERGPFRKGERQSLD